MTVIMVSIQINTAVIVNIGVSDASYRDDLNHWRVESRAIEILPRANETHGRHAEAKSALSKTVLMNTLLAGLRPLLPPSMRAKHNLKLQNGLSDKPDRLFKSISETWSSCLNNNADLKELIPEFYIPECSRSFFETTETQSRHRSAPHRKIDDVVLPTGKNDPVRFTSINRKVLESEITSVHLHEWIDLIFGVFQNDCKNKMLFPPFNV